MKKENKKIILYSYAALSSIALLIMTISLGIISSRKTNNDPNYGFQYNDYSYLSIGDKDNYLWENNPILFATDRKVGEEKSHGMVFDTINKNYGSAPLYRTQDMMFGSPVFENSKLKGYIGSDSTNDPNYKGVNFIDVNGKKTNIQKTYGDHEYFLLGNRALYIGSYSNSSDIIYVDNYKESSDFTIYNTREILGLPNQGANTYIYSSDEEHLNSFDIWNDELIINSRNLSTIYGLKFFKDSKILPPSEIELDWVLPNDPTAIYFIDDDNEGNHPINVVNEESTKNPDYNPTLTNSYKNKIISPFYNNKLYDLENKTEAEEFHDIDPEFKFFGEHRVSVLNKLLEENNFLDIDYNKDLIYISIHDNHQTGNVNNNLYSIWAKNPEDWQINGKKSYTKVMAINITDTMQNGIPPKSYELLLNFDNSELSKNDMYSQVCASSLFFSLKDGDEFHNYLSTNSANSRAIQLIEFDDINTTNKSLKNPKLVFEMNWDGSEYGYLYRGYTIFEDISNSMWGWNLMELQK